MILQQVLYRVADGAIMAVKPVINGMAKISEDDGFLTMVVELSDAVLRSYNDSYIDTTVDPVVFVTRLDNPSVADTLAITADDVDTATITLIPNPSTATVADGSGSAVIEILDGVLEITAATSDTITVSLKSFPYKDIQFIVEAT
jgi:hypothetical protein